MSENEGRETQNTFLLYNMSVTELNMANSQYSDKTKEMCEVAVLGTLTKIYACKDVYLRILQYMRDNDMYERFIKPILELQLFPPETPQSGEGKGEGESEEEGSESKKKGKSGGVGTKVDKYDKISKKFIQDFFNDDDI